MAENICFFGRYWERKDGLHGPANNNWKATNAWVEADGKLHLRLDQDNGSWSSSEVTSVDVTPDYGTFRVFVETDISNLDQNVVLGVFVYQDDSRELDIEFRKDWDSDVKPPPANGHNAQFVVQPYTAKDHITAFIAGANLSKPTWILEFSWNQTTASFKLIQNNDLTGDEFLVKDWSFLLETTNNPEPKYTKLHINLYHLKNLFPSAPVEIVISRAEFIPGE